MSLRSQFATLNKSNNFRGYNIKYAPYVLTEQGVAILASVLHTNIAEKASIKMRPKFLGFKIKPK